MKKFSRLFESKESILDLIGISEEEINDIIQDLIDEDYVSSITHKYLSMDGSIYYEKGNCEEFYPTIDIVLRRETVSSKEDVRNWDGSIYFEDDMQILSTISQISNRFDAILDKDGSKVYVSVKNVNNITIRITSKIEKENLPIDLSKFYSFISSLSDNNKFQFNDYNLDVIPKGEKKVSILITPKNVSQHARRTVSVNDLSSASAIDRIISRCIQNGSENNINELINITNKIIKESVVKCNKHEDVLLSDLTAFDFPQTSAFGNSRNRDICSFNQNEISIKHKKKDLVTFEAFTKPIRKENVIIAKAIFNNKTADIEIYDLRLNICIL